MNTVIIKWIDKSMTPEVTRAVEMSRWCKANGLVQYLDFDWFFKTAYKETEFRFYGEDGMATMFSLRWVK
jgi:hypothetical protein